MPTTACIQIHHSIMPCLLKALAWQHQPLILLSQHAVLVVHSYTSSGSIVLPCAARGSGDGGAGAASAATGQVDFSPAFIWLLRDFQLRLESNGRQISPAEYLEEALLPIKGGEQDQANRNKVQATLANKGNQLS